MKESVRILRFAIVGSSNALIIGNLDINGYSGL